MKIQSFSQIGKRSNNEDYLGYNSNVITVCDGIGGHVSGEIASKFVVESILRMFAERVPELNKSAIQEKLESIQSELNGMLREKPELENMGTTFTGLFITENVWYAAHIGDSRIYLFRPSEKKLWHTWDHSLVGEMMRNGDITCEAGRFHPMSNRISKAMIANSENRISSASVVKFDQLKKGDIFLLCSDGVIEAWGDNELKDLMSEKSLSIEEKCERMRQKCAEESKDNNTAFLVEIEKSDEFSYGNNEEIEWTSFADVEADYKQYMKDQDPEYEDDEEAVTVINTTETKKSCKKCCIAFIVMAVLLLCSLAMNVVLLWKNGEEMKLPIIKPLQETIVETESDAVSNEKQDEKPVENMSDADEVEEQDEEISEPAIIEE